MTSSQPPVLDGSKGRVLIVEDDMDTRDLLALILEDEGYRVDAIEDGRRVLEQVRQARPDVITLDIGLPGKSGRRVLEELEQDPDTAGIPVLVISAHTHVLGEPFRGHAAGVIAKPFYIPQILSEIQQALQPPATAS